MWVREPRDDKCGYHAHKELILKFQCRFSCTGTERTKIEINVLIIEKQVGKSNEKGIEE
jgi:hypothetical protein